MLLRISAVAAAVLLAGCVSNNSSVEPEQAEKTPVVKTNTKPADFHKQAASAEQIAYRLWNQNTDVAEEQLPDATELEDLWQRIQFQLTFNVPQTRPIVEQRNFYSSHQAYLDRVAGRAQPFLHYIVQELEKRNMPLELALLPIVESAFDPFAYSHAAAAGMWQFMPATGKRFGLKQNFWYDGRRDVIASTRAALDYLQYLHDKLEGDWLNAIAAYNSGEGRILNAIKRNKKRRLPTDFWSLDLPAETTAYVPKLLALVDILKRPDEFDIVWKFIANEPKIDVVEVKSQIDLAIAAEMAGINVSELQALNPGFNQWATDPDGPHYLVLPKQWMPKAAALLQAVYGDVALLPQAVTADFMLEGHFGRHLRKMRQLYQHKQQYCLRLIAEYLPEVKLHARYAGLHISIEFPYSVADQQLTAELLKQGYRVQPLSRYVFSGPTRTGLVIGLANTTESQLHAGVQLIARLLPLFKKGSEA